ncbi:MULTISPECIES: ABC transporter substrate-binding protein [unclassified Mesorhizobium]|uniref:ABC transporter substrate-binding protein n=1 Tax=unclassified Mesorhizobium TaxID=325217 RepID=UPI00112E6545|nr:MULTISPECIES: ABC transporter substrate-binding protein [unclassified Mesorhizobium]MBZ9680096.1 ABC transporter substrate-binding protein [Mesorhizobium sp. CO1-1-2]MBZ9695518.1 ABC transporter substrate-binding protein [Mesorhizobium sp. CO1-1-9]MBZ9928023.1 ABC transporter substrate-binding protein [Mesorhizobium sp. BR1-1-4]TPK15750.1 substrate-binding domain-containing protein [Mesorhizobium sp. B2-5-7]TPK74508.1 substrate-binding domain-containing protein [Mesorhizobium sp. B2-4-18]
MKTIAKLLCGAALAAVVIAPASAKDLNKVGISVGLLGNPFFVATIKGIEDAARKINPKVEVTSVSADYDLNKQVSQVDSFIAAGVDVIMLNAVDAKAIAPAVKKAQAAGIIVAAFDVSAPGADVTVMTNNVKAGEEACQYLVDHTGGKGDYVILNGPASSSILERVKGCKNVLAQHPDIKILSDDQNAEGSRDGGLKVFQSLLTRFDKIDAVFAINDPTAIGAELAAKQLNRSEFIFTAVDGAPDIEKELSSGKSMIKASASQDPYVMAGQSLTMAADLLAGKKPAEATVLLDPKLITAENLKDYKGWTAAR